MLALDDDDLLLDAPEEALPIPVQTYTAQTRSLGFKQSVVRWLPAAASGSRPLALAGSWDDPVSNELSVWSVQPEVPVDPGATMSDAPPEQPQLTATSVYVAKHSGCVLGLSVGGSQRLVAFTASGAGGASCYAIDISGGDDGAVLRPQWAGAAAPAGGLATLGVSYNEDANGVCAVGEDGVLTLLDPERGEPVWKAQTREPALFDVGWCTSLNANCVVTAGTSLGLWDMRQRSPAPQATLSAAPGLETHAGSALLCVAADPQPPYRLAAGAADGALHIWDVRGSVALGRGPASGASAMAPLKSIADAHAGDVWGVQLGKGEHGEMLSCGADGTLVAWSALDLDDTSSYDPPRQRTLVQLSLPINSVDLSVDHGLLASASDEQVLTFLDMRALGDA